MNIKTKSKKKILISLAILAFCTTFILLTTRFVEPCVTSLTLAIFFTCFILGVYWFFQREIVLVLSKRNLKPVSTAIFLTWALAIIGSWISAIFECTKLP